MSDWDELLPVIQLTINNTFNSTIKESPFFALYGYDSPTIKLSPRKLNYSEDDLNMHLTRVDKVRQHCRKELLEQQVKYTNYSNKNRKEKPLEIGQRVYAKLDKHKAHSKLDFPISGPFVIIGKKGNGFQLNDIANGEVITVHPDLIITGKTRTLEPK